MALPEQARVIVRWVAGLLEEATLLASCKSLLEVARNVIHDAGDQKQNNMHGASRRKEAEGVAEIELYFGSQTWPDEAANDTRRGSVASPVTKFESGHMIKIVKESKSPFHLNAQQQGSNGKGKAPTLHLSAKTRPFLRNGR